MPAKVLESTFPINVQEFILRISHKYGTMSFESQIHKGFFFCQFRTFHSHPSKKPNSEK